jgi:cyclopropane-fatty-acyl-phospholipid synthase
MNHSDTTGQVGNLSIDENANQQLSAAQLGFRKGIIKLLENLEDAHLVITDPLGTASFGDPDSELHVSLQILDASTYTDLAAGGAVAAAESYIQGKWITSDLTGFLRVFVRNRKIMLTLDGGLTNLLKPLRRLLHWTRRNSIKTSKKNILAHYDLGEDLFKTFLDPTLTYSSTIYEHSNSTLEESALYKLELICQKLQLTPDDHVVEIGTGWGGFAIYAAKNYGCRVTTTTISSNQHAVTARLIREAGLEDKITLLDKDYRLVEGKYDKLVSVEMIEAVGLAYLNTFFGKCSSLLKPDGRMLLQSITIADRHHERAARSVDFIQKYIFPGGALPSMGAIMNSVSGETDLQVTGLHDIGLHYAHTLKDWRGRFFEQLPQVRQLGYPDEFIRMWDYYLCYCESGFLERSISTMQLVFDKPECRLSLP